MSANGTPSQFAPHPFALYDVYNQARICKHPATYGKHPSHAVTAIQWWYMDLGFLQALQFGYSRPNKTKDRVVTSFDGFNSYLLVVNESTKYIWVYLCALKEPPIHMTDLHLDQFGAKSGLIPTDQGGELAGSNDFITRMAQRKFIVEQLVPTARIKTSRLSTTMVPLELQYKFYCMVRAYQQYFGLWHFFMLHTFIIGEYTSQL